MPINFSGTGCRGVATLQGARRTSIASPEGDFSWEATEKVHHVDHGGDGIFIFPTRKESVEGGGWVPDPVGLMSS